MLKKQSCSKGDDNHGTIPLKLKRIKKVAEIKKTIKINTDDIKVTEATKGYC